MNPASPKKNVLVAPLNWGLGHATRCIPIIRELLTQGHHVSIGSDGSALQLLKQEFPHLPFFELPSYHIQYPSGKRMAIHILKMIPALLKSIRTEHEFIIQLCKKESFDLILSDNRYGLWHPEIKSVFITHQLSIQPPHGFEWMSSLLRNFNFSYIRKFNSCWVPDAPGEENLSGMLSHGFLPPVPTTFIGPLSRFKTPSSKPGTSFLYDLIAIVSGPEPQRSVFENLILQQLEGINSMVLLIRGTGIHDSTEKKQGSVTIVNHLDSSAMEQAILSSRMVLCRSGYSSIMDLAALGKQAILVPTPGQTEQEYLASYLTKKKLFFSMSQSKFNLKKALAASQAYPNHFVNPPSALSHALKEITGD